MQHKKINWKEITRDDRKLKGILNISKEELKILGRMYEEEIKIIRKDKGTIYVKKREVERREVKSMFANISIKE